MIIRDMSSNRKVKVISAYIRYVIPGGGTTRSTFLRSSNVNSLDSRVERGSRFDVHRAFISLMNDGDS